MVQKYFTESPASEAFMFNTSQNGEHMLNNKHSLFENESDLTGWLPKDRVLKNVEIFLEEL